MDYITAENKLREKGYKEYPPSAVCGPTVISCFQKRFDDDAGQKYFINVHKHDMSFIPSHLRPKGWQPYSFNYEMFSSVGEEERSINIEFGYDWPVEAVETFAEDLFKKMNLNYHEKFMY